MTESYTYRKRPCAIGSTCRLYAVQQVGEVSVADTPGSRSSKQVHCALRTAQAGRQAGRQACS